MKWIAWIAALLLPLQAVSGPVEHVAIAAFQVVQTLEGHDTWEYGGILVKRNGVIQYSAIPRTDQIHDGIGIYPDRLLQPGDTLVGIYHTHPCIEGYYTDLYSIPDVIQAVRWLVPAFILNQCDGSVHEFIWGIDHIRDSGMTVTQGHKLVHLPAGRIVGSIK